MQKKNVLMMTMSLAMVGVVAVGGTLAYLTSNTNTLTNAFTVGDGYSDDSFYLDETRKIGDENPTEVGVGEDDRTKEGNEYAAMNIGDTVYKDPTFHLTSGPESYIFAYVEGVDAMVDEGFTFTGWQSSKWQPVNGKQVGYDGYYYYTETVEANEDIAPIFTNVSLPTSLSEMPDDANFDDVKISGIAIQAANIESWTDAWTALQSEAGAEDFLGK